MANSARKSPSYQKNSDREIGIKELKDQASAIIQSVQETGRPFLITKNRRAVARIEPVREKDPLQTMQDLGMISSFPSLSWKDLRLTGKPLDSTRAIEGILSDRNEE